MDYDSPMDLDVVITPGLSPMDRGAVEDHLAELLGGSVEFLGGGTMMGDPIVSDFSFGLGERDAEQVLATCREFFAGLGFTLPTKVEITLGDHAETLMVGGPTD